MKERKTERTRRIQHAPQRPRHAGRAAREYEFKAVARNERHVLRGRGGGRGGHFGA